MALKPIPLTTDGSGPAGAIPISLYGPGGGGGGDSSYWGGYTKISPRLEGFDLEETRIRVIRSGSLVCLQLRMIREEPDDVRGVVYLADIPKGFRPVELASFRGRAWDENEDVHEAYLSVQLGGGLRLDIAPDLQMAFEAEAFWATEDGPPENLD